VETIPNNEQDRLELFFEYLEREGFPAGPGERVRASFVAARAGKAYRERHLKTLLCPIFSRSEEEQRRFYTAYDLFFRPDELPSAPAVPTGEAVVRPRESSPPFNRKKWRRLGAVAVLLCLALAAIEYFDLFGKLQYWAGLVLYPPSMNMASPPAPNPPDFQIRRSTKTVDERTKRSCKGWECVASGPRPWVILSPFFLYVILLAVARTNHWRRYRTLSRERSRVPPFSWPVVTLPPTGFVLNPRLRHIAQALRRRISGDLQMIDVPTTVRATVKTGGFPRVVYQQSAKVPEYLFLVEQRSASGQDHLAAWTLSLASALAAAQVAIDVYTYSGDPRRLWPYDTRSRLRARWAPQSGLTLRRLLARTRGSRIALFSSGSELLHPYNGRLAGWAGNLVGDHGCTVFTPKAIFEWGEAEFILARSVPMAPFRLRSIALAMNGDHSSESLVRFLRSRESDDCASVPPEFMSTDGDVASLAMYLDDDVFQWLCACAVYPLLDWNLTLHLATFIDPAGGLYRERKILQLIRLPWFREGSIPGEWRARLVDSLPTVLRTRIREFLISEMERNPAPSGTFAADERIAQIAAQRYWSDPGPATRTVLERALAQLPDIDIGRDYLLQRLRSEWNASRGAARVAETIRMVPRKLALDWRLLAVVVALAMSAYVAASNLWPISDTRKTVISVADSVPTLPIDIEGQTLPPVPSCVSPRNAAGVLADIAVLYEETRRRMPSGDPRTARMTDLITAASRCERYIETPPGVDMYFKDFPQERDGFRIVALGLAEAAPKGRIGFAIEAIRNSRSAFEQFHGLVLAQDLIKTASATERDELRTAIVGQIGKTITVADLSRWEPAQEILKYLSDTVAEREPLRITITPGNPPSFQASGGAAPYKWISAASLPPGLSLTNAGQIVGSCKTAGTYRLSIVVIDAVGEKAAADASTDCRAGTESALGSDGQGRSGSGRTDPRQSDLRITALRESGDAGQLVTLYVQYTCNDLCLGGFLEATLISPDDQRVKINDRLQLSSGTLSVSLIILNTADSAFQSNRIEVCMVDDRTRRSLLCSTIAFVHTWASTSEGGRLIAPANGPVATQLIPLLFHVVDGSGRPVVKATVTVRRFGTSEILGESLTADSGNAEFSLSPGHYLINADAPSGSGQAEVTSVRDTVEVTIMLSASGNGGVRAGGPTQSPPTIPAPKPRDETVSLSASALQSSPSGQAWRNLLAKCAGVELTSGLLYLRPSNTVGPGSVWRLASDKSYRLRWTIDDILSAGPTPSSLIVSSSASSCQSADVQLALSLLPGELSARDVSNARIDLLRVGVDRLNQSAFMSLLRTGTVPQTYSEDLRAEGRFVMADAIKISGLSISVTLNSRSAARIKAALSSGVSSAFSYKWSSDTDLTIRSRQAVYIAGNLVQMSVGLK
jgi:hypothetical protein